MITLKESRKLRKLIKELVAAERADACKSEHDAAAIEWNLHNVRKRTSDFIDELRLPDGSTKS